MSTAPTNPLKNTGFPDHIQVADSLLAAAVAFSIDTVMITTADLPDLRIVYVNPAFTRMTGYGFAEVIGKSPQILHGSRTDKQVMADLQAKILSGEVFRGVAINYRKDGSEFVNEWHVAPIRDGDAKITHFLSVQRDVTERKKIEEELLQQKNILEQKHAALREVLELVEIEKKNIKESVSNNVEVVVLPALDRLGKSRTNKDKKYIGIIQEHLKDLTSAFGAQVSQPRHHLSPRESQIANLVKDGQSNRDIAASLNISIKTVETIRNKIRRKLGLVNKRVNLISYFRNA